MQGFAISHSKGDAKCANMWEWMQEFYFSARIYTLYLEVPGWGRTGRKGSEKGLPELAPKLYLIWDMEWVKGWTCRCLSV